MASREFFCFPIRQTYGDPISSPSSQVDADLFSLHENEDLLGQLRGLLNSRLASLSETAVTCNGRFYTHQIKRRRIVRLIHWTQGFETRGRPRTELAPRRITVNMMLPGGSRDPDGAQHPSRYRPCLRAHTTRYPMNHTTKKSVLVKMTKQTHCEHRVRFQGSGKDPRTAPLREIIKMQKQTHFLQQIQGILGFRCDANPAC